jgi:hypothetical protein
MDKYIYEVQSRKPHGKHYTRVRTNSYNQAVLYYRMINIGNGYSKRLLENGKVIFRLQSHKYL